MNTLTRAAIVALVVVAACKRRGGDAEASSLLVVSSLRGTTEPCGCTSNPLGGLDRLAARVEAHREAGARNLLMVGDTYFEQPTSPEHSRSQDEARAEVIASVLERLEPTALLLGPADLARGQKQPDVPTMLTLGSGLRVAVFQRPQLGARNCAELRGATARAEADVRVLLLASDGAEGRVCDSGVDIVLVPGGEEPRSPAVAAGALWIDAADKGRYLGQLTFHSGPPGPWTFYDEGKSARVTNDAKRERLRREIEALDDGPAKVARRAKLAELDAAQTTSEKPVGRYVTWKLEAIDREVQPVAWATQELQGFNRSLCDITTASTRERVCERAAIADQYVGTGVCQGCHAEEVAVYAKTAHAHAWATLENASKSCDLTCIGCHSVGYEKAGGYCRLDAVEQFKNVGCESCHGPGRGHAMNPADRSGWSTLFVRDPTAATCMTCHNPQHSDRFDFTTYRPRILGPGHGG